MTTAHLKSVSSRKTPQSQPVLGSTQVANNAGGYAWQVDKWSQLNRFLVLGSEGGSFYVGQRKLTEDNAKAVLACINEDGVRAVKEIVKISTEGRAPKNDYAIFALALAIAHGDARTRAAAGRAVNDVCRTGTHILMFADIVENFRGWGRGLRKAVASWYEDKDLEQLAYQVVKYRKRGGYSHRDLLRLAHPRANDDVSDIDRQIGDAMQWRDWQSVERLQDERERLARAGKGDLYDWVCGRELGPRVSAVMPRIVRGYEAAQNAASAAEAARLVREYRLTHEMLLSEHLADREVWSALLESMPIGALVRNLARMTANGLLTSQSDATKKVVEMLGNDDAILKARLHPIALLAALKTYEQGRGERGKLEWTPVRKIVDALDGAFYKAFGAVEPTGKRLMLSIDVSGSMEWDSIHGIPGLTPRVAAGALALVTANVEDDYLITAFSSNGYFSRSRNDDDGIKEIDLSPRQRLDDALATIARVPAGGTDCALPMLYAIKHDLEIDTFVVFTDSESWAGSIHASQALEMYRQKSGIPARLVCCAMVANEYSIADPSDPGQLDIVGFDTATPQIISDFSRGLI